MIDSSVVDQVRNLSSGDFSSQSVSELRESNIAIRHVLSWLHALQSQIIEAMKSASLAHESVMPEVELIRESGLSGSDVRKVMARTETIGFITVFGEALSEGNVTSELLVTARTMTTDEFSQFVKHTVRSLADDGDISHFEKQRRQTFLHHWVDGDGMTNLFGKFDPKRGSVLTALLDAGVEAMFHSGDKEVPVECDSSVQPNDHRCALALVALLTTSYWRVVCANPVLATRVHVGR